jgi:hypothetical protein
MGGLMVSLRVALTVPLIGAVFKLEARPQIQQGFDSEFGAPPP